MKGLNNSMTYMNKKHFNNSLLTPMQNFCNKPPPLSQIFSTFEDNFRKARSLFAISKLSLFNNFICNFL